MDDTWLTSLDAESTLRAVRRATVFDARWMQSYAGRMVTAAGKAGDLTQVAVLRDRARGGADRPGEAARAQGRTGSGGGGAGRAGGGLA